jgi:carbohydrate-selective porin OprB
MIPVVLACVASPVLAQTDGDSPGQSWLNQPYIFGDWGGTRNRLANLGLTFNFISVNDFLVNQRGGDANWSRVRGTADFDFGKAELVPGLTFHITGLWQGGGNMGAYIGSSANPSSLVSANTARLDSWWFEQALLNHKLYVRLGQFAGLDSYGAQPDGASYIFEPLGYAIGNLFPADYESFDPASTPAAEIRIVPSRHFYWKGAIFSGNRNPYQDDTNGFHFRFKDSPVVATEIGYNFEPTSSPGVKTWPGTYKLGATINPGQFSNIVTGVQSTTNYLMYVMANQRIYRPDAESDRGLDVNFAFDWTPGEFTRNYSQVTGGLRYHGLIPHREQDTVSVGVVYTRISPALNRSYGDAGLPLFGSEKAVEVNYALKIARWFTFQPVVQYYFDTGANPLGHNSVVAGFRTSFTL